MRAGLLLTALTGLWLLGVRLAFGADPLAAAWAGGAAVPELLPSQPWRMLSAPWLHVEVWHWAANAGLTLLLCTLLEARVGVRALVSAFVLGGLGGAVASQVFTGGWALGASGGAFALLGVAARVVWARGPGASAAVLALALALDLAGPADHAAHLGGLLLGLLPWGAPLPLALAFPALGALGVLHLSSSPAPTLPGAPLPLCSETLTDGLRFACLSAEAPSALRATHPEGRHEGTWVRIYPSGAGHLVVYSPSVAGFDPLRVRALEEKLTARPL